MLRNPSPWHCEQDSFATAIVSERFQSKFTNVSSRYDFNKLHRMFLQLISQIWVLQCIIPFMAGIQIEGSQ